MGRNVEIKARVTDLEALRARVEALADDGPHELRQEDVFFPCAAGRLKLRRTDGGGELIHYRRPDVERAATSHFRRLTVADPEAALALLGAALGVRGVVRKRRQLYRAGTTRIHLDRVEGLGDFLELEVVLTPAGSEADGRARAAELMAILEIPPDDLVDVAYIDLLDSASR